MRVYVRSWHHVLCQCIVIFLRALIQLIVQIVDEINLILLLLRKVFLCGLVVNCLWLINFLRWRLVSINIQNFLSQSCLRSL